jgi:small subunit ribosomal protein S9
MANEYFEGIGRRKESSARVRLMAGSGTFTVNGKELEAYFTRMGDVPAIVKAFEIASQAKKELRRDRDGAGRWCDRTA